MGRNNSEYLAPNFREGDNCQHLQIIIQTLRAAILPTLAASVSNTEIQKGLLFANRF
jgi:hypothetical protein